MQEIHEYTSGFEIIPLKKIYERKWCHAIMMHDVLYSTYSVWGIDLSNQSESPWMISPGTSSQTFTRRSNERWILYVQVCSFHYIQLSCVQNADCKCTELPTVSHPLFPESWSHPLNKNCCDSDRTPPTSACFAWSSLIPVSIAALQISRSSLAKSELSASPAAPKHPKKFRMCNWICRPWMTLSKMTMSTPTKWIFTKYIAGLALCLMVIEIEPLVSGISPTEFWRSIALVLLRRNGIPKPEVNLLQGIWSSDW